jgi:hypothetical protein
MTRREMAFVAASIYVATGLSHGLIMAQVLPLTAFGVGYYTVTWPQQIYCARPEADCFASVEYLPLWFQRAMFDLGSEADT